MRLNRSQWRRVLNCERRARLGAISVLLTFYRAGQMLTNRRKMRSMTGFDAKTAPMSKKWKDSWISKEGVDRIDLSGYLGRLKRWLNGS